MKYFVTSVIASSFLMYAALAAAPPVQGKVISPESVMTTPLQVTQKKAGLRSGTGFFIEYSIGSDKQLFIATNIHVLAGDDYAGGLTDKPVGDTVSLVCRDASINPLGFTSFPILDKSGKRLWEESRSYAGKVPDVAVLPLPKDFKKQCPGFQAFTAETLLPKVSLHAGSQVFEVGYPEMLMDQSTFFPVWKSGTIASEPASDFQDQPVILVDLTGFHGSSGSPVIQIYRGISTPTWSMGMGSDPSNLVGINSASTQAGLSYVWKASVVKDILDLYVKKKPKDSLPPFAR